MLTPYVRTILQATVYDVAIHTPLNLPPNFPKI